MAATTPAPVQLAPPPGTGRSSATSWRRKCARCQSTGSSRVHADGASRSRDKPYPSWGRIELREDRRTDYALTLHYKPEDQLPFVIAAAVEADTKEIARAVLAELLRQGRKPMSEGIYVFVSAQQRVYGETGTPLARAYGHPMSDYGTDQLKFQSAKKR